MYNNYEDYNTLSTAEYADIISDAYDDYIESWFTFKKSNTVENRVKEQPQEKNPIMFVDDADLPF